MGHRYENNGMTFVFEDMSVEGDFGGSTIQEFRVQARPDHLWGSVWGGHGGYLTHYDKVHPDGSFHWVPVLSTGTRMRRRFVEATGPDMQDDVAAFLVWLDEAMEDVGANFPLGGFGALMVRPLAPMLVNFGHVLFDRWPIYRFLPEEARWAAEASTDGVICTAQLGANPEGKLSLLLMYGASSIAYDETSQVFSSGGEFMAQGPLDLIRWMSWLKGNIVFVARSPGVLDDMAPFFVGPEFVDGQGQIYGLDHPDYIYGAMPFVTGREKPRSARRALYFGWNYIKEPHVYARRVLGVSPRGEVRTRSADGRGETLTRPLHNFDEFAVVFDRLLEMGEIDP